MRTTVLALAAAVPIAAWAMGKAPAPREKQAAAVEGPMQEWKGQFSGIAEPRAVLVTDGAAWSALWKEAFGREAPEADFSSSVAAAVFAGSRNTGGYVVEFLDPEVRGSETVLRWRVKSPGKGAFVIQAFTQPFAVRLYPKPPGPVSLEKSR